MPQECSAATSSVLNAVVDKIDQDISKVEQQEKAVKKLEPETDTNES